MQSLFWKDYAGSILWRKCLLFASIFVLAPFVIVTYKSKVILIWRLCVKPCLSSGCSITEETSCHITFGKFIDQYSVFLFRKRTSWILIYWEVGWTRGLFFSKGFTPVRNFREMNSAITLQGIIHVLERKPVWSGRWSLGSISGSSVCEPCAWKPNCNRVLLLQRLPHFYRRK